jgi:kynurenine formamidase
MRLVDLSVPIVQSPPETPDLLRVEIERTDHAAGAREIEALFGVPPRLLRDGEGWTVETLRLGTHSATHVDAPWHYFPTCGGEPARTIDQLPLDWFVRPGVRLDLRALERGAEIAPDDLERAVAAAGRELEPYDIVLLWTGAEDAWGTPEYVNAGSGLGRDGTLWLLDRGVKVIGTDAWGLDRPLGDLRAQFERDRDPAPLWAAHRVGIEREYCQIEKLHNLGALPAAGGFTVSCLPVKITGASAGWCRAVAMLPDGP